MGFSQFQFALVQKDRVYVAFKMVDGDQGEAGGEGQSFGVCNAHKKCTRETRTGGYGNGVQVGEGDAGLGQGGANDRNDGAKVLAAGEFGDDSAVTGVGGDLRGDDGRERMCAVLDYGSGGLVAGGFDGENQAAAHASSLSTCGGADAVCGKRRAGGRRRSVESFGFPPMR